MTRKIGLFETEQQVIQAIQQLEQAGFAQGELMVLAKDSEHSRRIEAESDVHVDEITELAETSAVQVQGSDTLGMMAAAGFGSAVVPTAYGLAGYGTGGLLGGAYPFGAALLFDDDEHSRVYHSLGLDDEETHICSQALQSGSVIIVVETDGSKSLQEVDGGPDLSRLGIAEAVFRSCNASSIVDGV